MASTDKPLGVRLHNPCNLRPGSPWEGLAEPDEVSGFCNFVNPVFGFRAAVRNLMTYYDRYKIQTIKGIVERWAPPGDNNDTPAYIAAVCKRTGYGPDDQLDLKSFNTVAAVVRAMTVQEQGSFSDYFTQEQLAEGAFRAGIQDAPPPLAKRVLGAVAGVGSAVGSVATGAIGVAQPAIMATNNTKLIIAFAIVSGILGLVAAWTKVRPKTQGGS